MAQAKIVILDRDGVINFDSTAYIKSPDEWIPIPGSLEGIARLCDAGFEVFIVSNQSGLARGLFSFGVLEQIHQKMIDAIELAGGRVAGIFYCPHGPDDGCDCRKPKTGLLRQIERATGQTLSGQLLIGDKCSDVDAALGVGARAILVRTGHGEQSSADCAERVAAVFPDLGSAAAAIVNGQFA